jgi:nitrogen regulatory protein PII
MPEEAFMNQTFELVVAVVRRGMGDKAVAAAVEKGARGVTIISGRSAGSDEAERVFGLAIEPERDVILATSPCGISDKVAEAIDEVADVTTPGNGYILILPVARGLSLSKLVPDFT